MFERFTDRARRVIVLAQEEARLFNHNYIGTEHILLGLSRGGEGVAATTLASMNVSLDAVRAQVEQIIGRGKSTPPGHIPFTPHAKRVMELSLREALQLGHNYIGTGHILLGLVKEEEGVGAEVLRKLCPPLPGVRDAVLEAFAIAPADPKDSAPVIDYSEGVPAGLATGAEGATGYVSYGPPAHPGPLHPTRNRLCTIGFAIGLAGCAAYVISSLLPYFKAPPQSPGGLRSISAFSLSGRGATAVAIGGWTRLYGTVAVFASICILGASSRSPRSWAIASLAVSVSWGVEAIGALISTLYAPSPPKGVGVWGMHVAVLVVLAGGVVATFGARRMTPRLFAHPA